MIISTDDSEIVDLNDVSIISITQGFLGFLIPRCPADVAYPGPTDWKWKPCASENETMPCRRSVRQWQRLPRGEGGLLLFRVFRMSRSLPLP